MDAKSDIVRPHPGPLPQEEREKRRSFARILAQQFQVSVTEKKVSTEQVAGLKVYRQAVLPPAAMNASN
jgi:hypothetical protein